MLTCAKQTPFLSCSRKETVFEFQRKTTRGRVLWTPLRNGESKGKTRVAAIAVGRGLGVPHSARPLSCTSDERCTAQRTRGSQVQEPGSAERGRLRDQAILLLTGDAPCSLSARERFRQKKPYPRSAALFFLTPGAARSFFSGKSRKERMGGRIKQLTSCDHVR